jgi:hypothetical protein
MSDNTITLMQYIKTTMQVEDEQLRTMLGIGKFGRAYAELICR